MVVKHGFLFCVCLMVAMVIKVTLPKTIPSVGQEIRYVRVSAHLQNRALNALSDAKINNKPYVFYVDAVDFTEGVTLFHKSLGNLHLKRNFLLELECYVFVKTAGSYDFTVASDDGFELLIDKKVVSSFLGNRAFESTTKAADLAAGYHHFRLRYFQGDGPLGLRWTYRSPGSREGNLVGSSSGDLEFNLFPINRN